MGIGPAADRPGGWLGLLAAELIDKRLVFKDDCFGGVGTGLTGGALDRWANVQSSRPFERSLAVKNSRWS